MRIQLQVENYPEYGLAPRFRHALVVTSSSVFRLKSRLYFTPVSSVDRRTEVMLSYLPDDKTFLLEFSGHIYCPGSLIVSRARLAAD
jgi:hypothetical protein